MVKWNIDRGLKPTGGKINLNRKRRKFQRMGLPLMTELGEKKIRKVEGRGMTRKIKLVASNSINVVTKGGKMRKVKVIDVKSNQANLHYVRRRIITKGTIVEPELGHVRATSRSSQSGILSGIIVSESKSK